MRTIGSEPNASGRVSAPIATPPTISWAPPHARHRPQIIEILAETGVFRPDEIDVALEVFDGYCEDPGVDYRALGAFSGPDELAGFAFYGPTPCTIDTWDLYWIAVGPTFQGTGIGRGLLERVERQLLSEGARMCLIETSSKADYATTRHFYLSCGYDERARVLDFYADGDDRVIYVKRFARSLSVRRENESREARN